MMELETTTDTDAETAPEADLADAPSEAEPDDGQSRYDLSSLGPVVAPIESDIFAGFRGGASRFNYAIWTGYAVTGLIAASLFIGIRTLPAKPATLIVTTSPPDVTLIVDGEVIEGRSPFRLDHLVPEDDHVIVAQRNGFESSARRVSLAPGEIRTLRAIALAPIPPEPGVTSAPLESENGP
jgi:hypothetical protein